MLVISQLCKKKSKLHIHIHIQNTFAEKGGIWEDWELVFCFLITTYSSVIKILYMQLAQKHCIKTGNYCFTEKIIYTYLLVYCGEELASP